MNTLKVDGDELSPAYSGLGPSTPEASYGLIESVGRGRTDIDGGDQEHYQEDCEEYAPVFQSNGQMERRRT